MYCYIYAGLLDCAADGTLCGESNETIGVCGEPLMTPHSFFSRTLSQVTPSSYCLRWLPTVVTARFDFGPGSI